MVEPDGTQVRPHERVPSRRTGAAVLLVLAVLLVAAVSSRSVAAGVSREAERAALSDGLALLHEAPAGLHGPVLDCGAVAATHTGPDGYRTDDGDNAALDCFAAAIDAHKDVTLHWSLVLPPHPQRSAADAVAKHRFRVVTTVSGE